MNQSDITALMRGIAPSIEGLLARAVEPLVERIGQLEADLAASRRTDAVRTAVAGAVEGIVPLEVRSAVAAALPDLVASAVREAVAALPAPQNGADADPAVIERMVGEAVAALPKPKDGDPGASVDPETVRQMVAEEVAAIPPAQPGKDADPAAVAEMVRSAVAEAVAEIRVPEDGRSPSPEEVVPLIEERLPAIISEALAGLPVPKDGAPGKLGIVRAWEDRVFYEAEVATFDGAIYQAQRDTGRSPPHDDWLCIVSRGDPGKDAGEIEITGTFDVTRSYKRLNVVALNGGSFIAKRDDPGPCPGDGWQLVASQGNRGKPGEATKGDPGRPGPSVRNMEIDDQGMLTLTNADGTKVNCDLYPLLAKVASTEP